MRKSMKRMLRMTARTATIVAALAVFTAPGALTTPKAAAQEAPCDATCVHLDLPVLTCTLVVTIIVIDEDSVTVIDIYACTEE